MKIDALIERDRGKEASTLLLTSVHTRVCGRGVRRSSLSRFCKTLSREREVQLITTVRIEARSQPTGNVHKDSPRRTPCIRGGGVASAYSFSRDSQHTSDYTNQRRATIIGRLRSPTERRSGVSRALSTWSGVAFP